MAVLSHCPNPRAWRYKPVRAQLQSNCKITRLPPQLQHAHQALFKAGFSWKTLLAFSCSVSSRFSSAVLKTACRNEELSFWGFASLPFVWKNCAVCSGEDLNHSRFPTQLSLSAPTCLAGMGPLVQGGTSAELWHMNFHSQLIKRAVLILGHLWWEGFVSIHTSSELHVQFNMALLPVLLLKHLCKN